MEYGTFLGLDIEETIPNKTQPQKQPQLPQPPKQSPNEHTRLNIHRPPPSFKTQGLATNQQLDRHAYPPINSKPPEPSYPDIQLGNGRKEVIPQHYLNPASEHLRARQTHTQRFVPREYLHKSKVETTTPKSTFVAPTITTNDPLNKLLSTYFGNPIVTKLKDTKGESHYYAKVKIQLLTENRYLIIITPLDKNPIGMSTPMGNLGWKSIQTRILKTRYNVGTFIYKNSRDLNRYKLVLIKRDIVYTSYYNKELKLKVFVFHTTENNPYEYPDNPSLDAAVEQYQTILTKEY